MIAGILLSSCEKKDNSVIDPVLHFPTIDSASITPTTFDTNIIHIQAYAHVISEEPIQRVTATVYDPLSSSRANITLSNAGNNQYTGTLDFTMGCRLVGQYRVEFVALNNENLYSNAFPVSFNVINSKNQKPVLSNLIAPDSLLRPPPGETTYVFLQVTASDTNGSCDVPVNGVFFNSFKPDGTGANGNPFTMYDDGNPGNCDQVAGDQNYSRCVIILNIAQLGNYQFKFNARDNSGLLSDTLVHQINVHE